MRAPQGTIAFLFTDVEGSTKLWETSPKEASLAIRRHDELLSAMLGSKGKIFKTIGDAFCVAYPTVQDAAAAALDVQAELRALVWPESAAIQVRMAIHAGTAEFRDGDYFGATLNRAARILSAGHGGQILLSEVAFGLLRESLPDDILTKKLGEFRLKDLGRPEVVYQLWRAGLEERFPPLRSLESYANNLPPQATSFVGREDELQALHELKSKHRIVTIVGSGGCGKTRLALQTAADHLDSFPDGAWFVELAAVLDPASVPNAVASSLGLRETPGRNAVETVIEYLANRRLLLVLDNCEHLLDGAASLAGRILNSCPEVNVLATSRELLGVPGEFPMRIRSLTIPSASDAHEPDSLSQYESVRLFINRAQIVRPDFHVSDQNAPAVAELCCKLEGIPLAIELAAARLRSMSVEDVLKRLDDMFRILVGGSRTSLLRHQTLHALIDWSYQLLAEEEQALLQRLSVFAGGWSLESAEGVCARGALEETDIVNCMTGLVDKSIVDCYGSFDEPRYRLLEAIRQFALKKLREAGLEHEARQSHFDWFLSFFERQYQAVNGPNDHEAMTAMKQEHANAMASIEWRLEQSEPTVKLAEYCRILSSFWESNARYREGIDVCDRVGEKLETLPASQTYPLLMAKGRLQTRMGNYVAALALMNEAMAGAVEDDNPLAIVWCKHYIGACLHMTGELQSALNALQEGYDLATEHALTFWRISCANGLGLTTSSMGRHREGLEYMEHAMELTRETGSAMRMTLTLNNLGVLYRDTGRLDDARRVHEEGLAICERYGVAAHKVYHKANLGGICWMQGDIEGAASHSQYAIRESFKAGDIHRTCECVRDAFAIASIREQWERAARLFGATTKQSEALSIAMDEPDEKRYLPHAERTKAALGESEFDLRVAEGAAWPWEQVVEYALDGSEAAE